MLEGATELLEEVLYMGREGPLHEEVSQSWEEHSKWKEEQVQRPCGRRALGDPW